MQRFRLVFNILQGNASHTAYRIGEIFIDHFFANTDRLKNLGALVRLDRGDSHLRRDLDDPVQHCRVIIVDCRIIILFDHAAVDELTDGFLCQIRIDRTGPVTQQRCKMMHLARLAGFQHDGKRRSLLRLDQILMHSRHGKQRRNRHMVFIHAAVCQHKNIYTITVRLVDLHKQPLNRTLDAGTLIISNRNLRYLKAFHLHMLDLQHIGVCQNRVIHLQHLTVFRRFLQKVSVFSDVNGR